MSFVYQPFLFCSSFISIGNTQPADGPLIWGDHPPREKHIDDVVYPPLDPLLLYLFQRYLFFLLPQLNQIIDQLSHRRGAQGLHSCSHQFRVFSEANGLCVCLSLRNRIWEIDRIDRIREIEGIVHLSFLVYYLVVLNVRNSFSPLTPRRVFLTCIFLKFKI